MSDAVHHEKDSDDFRHINNKDLLFIENGNHKFPNSIKRNTLADFEDYPDVK